MTVHRFFVSPESAAGERFVLPTAIERQVRRVLRLGDGDRIVLLTGDGQERHCRLEAGDCVVEARRPAGGEPGYRLTVAQALLRGDALEEVVRQGTEVGVARFQLFVSERCVARTISPGRLDRLRTIAREAAEQSERGIVPEVDAPVRLAEVTPASVLLYERHDGRRLGELEPPSVVVIGPEGGFSPAEAADAEAAGATLAGLGPRILRSSTVAVAAAAVLLSRTGDFA
ncbi:MAG TPA: RsmE family RNA methyltransferase [Candidatus Limnocylindria bacterium]